METIFIIMENGQSYLQDIASFTARMFTFETELWIK